MSAQTSTSAALEPVRAALLAQARSEGDRLRAAAQHDAAAAIATAGGQADAIVAAAHQDGVRAATARLRLDRARVQRDCRRLVLVAQRQVYDDIVEQARVRVRALLATGPTHEQLAAQILQRLGPGAAVHPCPEGGLIGQAADGSIVDASDLALVDQAIASLDLEPLWTAG